VWARKNVSLNTCPKSFITGESLALLEDFLFQRRIGQSSLENMTARQADAFLVLEEAVAMEMKDVRQESRSTI